MYATHFCLRNSSIEKQWDAWTSHLSGPPSNWETPSHNLYKFAGQTHASQYGLSRPLYGYKNESGVTIIEPQFVACGDRFIGGLSWASEAAGGRSGWINPDGTWAIIVDGNVHSDFIGGIGKFHTLDSFGYPMYGFVDRQGVVVVPPSYRSATWYVNGYVLVHERTMVGRFADWIGKLNGVFPKTCFEARSVVIDMSGNEAVLPK